MGRLFSRPTGGKHVFQNCLLVTCLFPHSVPDAERCRLGCGRGCFGYCPMAEFARHGAPVCITAAFTTADDNSAIKIVGRLSTCVHG